MIGRIPNIRAEDIEDTESMLLLVRGCKTRAGVEVYIVEEKSVVEVLEEVYVDNE